MYINAMGYYVPEGRVTNEYFKEKNGLTPEWIEQRTGIRTRSKAGAEENIDTMAFAAVDDAISKLKYDIKDVNLIVAAHYCAYDTVATVAHKVQRRYGINSAKALYVSSACSSFINGLEVIEGYFAMGKADKALLVCSEQNTYYANESDTKCGHLWGDAAVAFVLSKDRISDSDLEIIDIYTEGLGDLGKGPGGVLLRPKENGIEMPDGRDVFLYACRYMIHAIKNSCANLNIEPKDISKIICHQANKRIVAQVAHILERDMDDFINNIEEYGNTGSASAPLVLAQNIENIEAGTNTAVTVFGGGYSCGCFIVKK